MPYTVAGIDVHKKVLMVMVRLKESTAEWGPQRRRFGTVAKSPYQPFQRSTISHPIPS